ncbi:hypothetical protein ABFP37_16005 [Burkholderia sp. RS01]|uniref:hypothetical protein n=1 Tax=unclassified Burkholderia TaxID=2613784 RepID=UPI0026D58A00
MTTRPGNLRARAWDTSTLVMRMAVSTASASRAGSRAPNLVLSSDILRRPA